ncbi:MAG: LLM class flavin-dependent oxidoreductase [Conexivisphaerales archaeon]
MSTKIKFGLFDQLELPAEQDYETMLRQKFEIVRLADRLGCFDTFFSTERHFTRLSVNLSQSVLLSALSQITSQIRLCALVYVLPIRNPLLLAEEIAMLDHITSGRLEVGFGSGISELELRYFGLSAERARLVSREAFDLLFKYFTFSSNEFSFTGRYFKYHNVPRLVKPLQKPHPPIWIPSRNRETMKWLGGLGLNTAWIFDSYETIKTAFDVYWKNFKPRNGMPKVGIVRHVFVAKSDETAIRTIKPALINYGRDERFLFGDRKKSYAKKRIGYEPFDLYAFEDPNYILSHEIAIAGSPKTVSEKIRKAISITGANYFIPYMDFGSMKHEDVQESLQLFSSDVYPDFSG